MGEHRRQVRSFVRRAGRTTPGQARALETLWPVHGVPRPGDWLDLDALFGRRAPWVAESGFGNGEADEIVRPVIHTNMYSGDPEFVNSIRITSF